MTSIANKRNGRSWNERLTSRRGTAEGRPTLWSGLTLPMVGATVYLWVIHSQRLPIATPALVFGLLGLLLARTPLRFPAPWLWFAGLVAWSMATSPLSPLPDQALAGAWDLLKLGVIFFLIVNLAHTRRQLLTFLVLWLGIYAYYPVRGTLFNLAFGIATQGRYAWNFIFENPNDLAALTLPVLGMAIGVIPLTRGWTRYAAIAGAALLPGIIFATQSRGGIVALAVMAAVLGRDLYRSRPREAPDRATRRRRSRQRMAVLAIAMLAGISILLFAPQGVWDRLAALRGVTDTEQLEQVDREGSAEQRFEIWKVSWTVSAEHPVTGVGISAYPLVHQEYATRSTFKTTAQGPRDSHSTYFGVLAETGVVGLSLFLGMLISAFRLAAQTLALGGEGAMLARSLRAGLIGFLAACVFATMHKIALLYAYVGLLCLVAEAYAPAPRAGPRPAVQR